MHGDHHKLCEDISPPHEMNAEGYIAIDSFAPRQICAMVFNLKQECFFILL